RTSPGVVSTAVAFGRRMGKTAIVVKDSPGFWINRILTPYMNEAGYLLAEGVAVEDLDALMADWGFPVGPITLLDEVGMDVAEKVAGVLHAAFGERLAPAPAFAAMVKSGRLGRKAGKGFYKYAGGKKGAVDAAVYELIGVHPNGGPRPAEIIQRLVLMMLNEAARAVAEGIVRTPRAGETVDSGVAALKNLNAAGITASLDVLGESVHNAAEAHAARNTYLETLDRIRGARADANVSLKLTQMGLDIDERLCVENLRAIIARAQGYGSFVRIDMEQSEYAERTLQLFKRTFHPEFGNTVGVVLQSYLRRTEQDVEQMIALGPRVRLCKGAYQEPATVAFPGKRDVDTTYVGCMERLLLRGTYPGIATHDAHIIEHAKTFARDKGVAPARFEFQMLYGVRRDLQIALRRQGYNV